MAKSSHKQVEHLDLRISIPNNMIGNFENWLEDFHDHEDYVVTAPRLTNGVLRINSVDVVGFLGYLDPSVFSELELARLKKTLQQQLSHLQQKSLSPDFRYHYQWCLAAIENLPWGRHLDSDPQSLLKKGGLP